MAAKGKKKKVEIEDVMMTNEAENEAKSAEDALLDEMDQEAEDDADMVIIDESNANGDDSMTDEEREKLFQKKLDTVIQKYEGLVSRFSLDYKQKGNQETLKKVIESYINEVKR